MYGNTRVRDTWGICLGWRSLALCNPCRTRPGEREGGGSSVRVRVSVRVGLNRVRVRVSFRVGWNRVSAGLED